MILVVPPKRNRSGSWECDRAPYKTYNELIVFVMPPPVWNSFLIPLVGYG